MLHRGCRGRRHEQYHRCFGAILQRPGKRERQRACDCPGIYFYACTVMPGTVYYSALGASEHVRGRAEAL